MSASICAWKGPGDDGQIAFEGDFVGLHGQLGDDPQAKRRENSKLQARAVTVPINAHVADAAGVLLLQPVQAFLHARTRLVFR